MPALAYLSGLCIFKNFKSKIYHLLNAGSLLSSSCLQISDITLERIVHFLKEERTGELVTDIIIDIAMFGVLILFRLYSSF